MRANGTRQIGREQHGVRGVAIHDRDDRGRGCAEESIPRRCGDRPLTVVNGKVDITHGLSPGMVEPPIVHLTERAGDHIRSFLADQPDTPPLRLSVVRTHCMGGRGHAYDLRVAEARKEDDVVLESRGVTLLIDLASVHLLSGVEVDFVETLQGSGIEVHNPNAVGKCPCGHHDLFA